MLLYRHYVTNSQLVTYVGIDHRRWVAGWAGGLFTYTHVFTRHSLVERRAMYLFYSMFFCLFGQRLLSNPRADSLGGKKRGNDMGVDSFVHRTATISIFLSDAKCSPICRAQTCAHSGAETSRSAKGFLQGGPKSSKKFRIFYHFEV